MIKNYFKLILAFIFLLVFIPGINGQEKNNEITKQDVTAASKLIGLEFSDTEQDSMLDELHDHLNLF